LHLVLQFLQVLEDDAAISEQFKNQQSGANKASRGKHQARNRISRRQIAELFLQDCAENGDAHDL